MTSWITTWPTEPDCWFLTYFPNHDGVYHVSMMKTVLISNKIRYIDGDILETDRYSLPVYFFKIEYPCLPSVAFDWARLRSLNGKRCRLSMKHWSTIHQHVACCTFLADKCNFDPPLSIHGREINKARLRDDNHFGEAILLSVELDID